MQIGRQKQVTSAGKPRLVRHNFHAGGKRPVQILGSKWGVETDDLKQVRWREWQADWGYCKVSGSGRN